MSFAEQRETRLSALHLFSNMPYTQNTLWTWTQKAVHYVDFGTLQVLSYIHQADPLSPSYWDCPLSVLGVQYDLKNMDDVILPGFITDFRPLFCTPASS